MSQLSYIILGAALLNASGVMGGSSHITNHAVSKITLFLCAGSIYASTHKTEISQLSGLARRMPWTMAAFTLGAISMVGIPPAAGFFSKWWAVQAAVERDQWHVVVVVLGSSLLTAVYLFRVLERVYLHPTNPEHAADPHTATAGTAPDDPTTTETTEATESPADAVLPLVLLAIAGVALGVMSSIIVTHVLEPGL